MAKKPSWRLVDRLRFLSHSGRIISRHRALRTLDFRPASILHPIILMILCYLGLTVGIESIAMFWDFVLAQAVPVLTGSVQISHQETTVLGVISATVPYPQITGVAPNGPTLLMAAIVALTLMALAYIFLRNRALPVGYLIWAISLLQLLACGVFYLAAERFPHSLSNHVANGFSYSLNLMFICPLVLAVTYFVFDYPLLQKIIGTLCIMAALVIATPSQYVIHIGLIHHFSLVVMPVLFIFFGLLFNIAVFIAIFGWCVSWEK